MSVVLIVEDNEKNMKLLRDLLQFRGYKTIEAMNGNAGVQLAKEQQPDLVLMDIQLPGIDGITALGQIRQDPRTQGIPVIAVSAFAMPDDQQRIGACGFDAYVTKPIRVREFLGVVERFARNKKG